MRDFPPHSPDFHGWPNELPGQMQLFEQDEPMKTKASKNGKPAAEKPAAPAWPAPTILANVREVRLGQIEPDPDQPRREIDPDELARLADTIRARGLLQPIRVRPLKGEGHRYRIIAGERRWRAAEMAGLAKIPCVVVEGDDDPVEVLLDQVAENTGRLGLAPLEEAWAFAKILETKGWTQGQLAAQVGVGQSDVSKRLALLKLAPEVQGIVAAGNLDASSAYELRRLGEWDQIDLANRAFTEQWSRDRVIQEVERQLTPPPPPVPSPDTDAGAAPGPPDAGAGIAPAESSGEPRGPDAADPDDWRSLRLAEVLTITLADALKLDWGLETLGQLGDALADGETLEDLALEPAEAVAVREALMKLREEKGWGPQEGFLAEWLIPDRTREVIRGESPGAAIRNGADGLERLCDRFDLEDKDLTRRGSHVRTSRVTDDGVFVTIATGRDPEKTTLVTVSSGGKEYPSIVASLWLALREAQLSWPEEWRLCNRCNAARPPCEPLCACGCPEFRCEVVGGGVNGRRHSEEE